jgi:hypothetical protein
MPDHLDRLSHLAPRVDADGALAAAQRAGRAAKRRRIAVAGLGLVVVLLAGSLLAVDHRSRHDDRVTTDPGATKTETTRIGDIELSLTLPSDGPAIGERSEVSVLLRNVGPSVASVRDFAACGSGPGLVVDGPWPPIPPAPPSTTTGTDAVSPPVDVPTGWDGHAALRDHLLRATGSNASSTVALFRDRAAADTPQAFTDCPASSTSEGLNPGESKRWSGVVDLRLPVHHRSVLTVLATASVSPSFGSAEIVPTVEVDLPVGDEAARTALRDDAISAFERSDELRRFLDATDDQPVTQLWDVSMDWWHGGWELTVIPVYGGTARLSLRYDPEHRQVVQSGTSPDLERALEPYVGGWIWHGASLHIDHSGAFELVYRTYSSCAEGALPPCDTFQPDGSIESGGKVFGHLATVDDDHLVGTIDRSNDPYAWPVGKVRADLDAARDTVVLAPVPDRTPTWGREFCGPRRLSEQRDCGA